MTSKKTWKYWSSAVIVNLGAAAVAAFAFSAWQRLYSGQNPAQVPAVLADPVPTVLVDDVGYVPKANIRIPARGEVDGRTIYDVTYEIGPDHFRVVPEATESPDACVLLFGDSFIFGIGVSDDETAAAQIVLQSGRRVAAQNFGIPGWGPHQFLAGLESGRFQRAARCRPTDAVYLMIPSHIWRASGVTNPWDTNGPRYRLDADGRPVRAGTLGDPDPNNWRRWLGLDPVSKADAAGRARGIIVEAVAELKQLYPGIRTHFISYRVVSWSDTGYSNDELTVFEDALRQAAITPIPLDAIMPLYRFEQRDYVLDLRDTHPNARAHHLIAEFILKRVSSSR